MGAVWAMAIPMLLVLLFPLAVLEVWDRRFLPWHRRGDSSRTASSVVTEAILGGTKQHKLEQRQVQLMLVDGQADGAPPRPATHSRRSRRREDRLLEPAGS
ncbi:hypothetical protein Amsp01_022880 [Amycolatopsis sp. NBRC 101858]|uniref:DUF6191 domain-containing protein n=1 Tax=Amycolatopsis sp. NBRC 101858 TaxID=3032200 RepID=UPI0024A3F494|nr:DUF6191 domain-containing protein [Amycolatopsis sp. NBRC 101858]GLY36264.1 hypothetical protein Amsp01_022880 [Amycolatopsis sp. NBRC 101858]